MARAVPTALLAALLLALAGCGGDDPVVAPGTTGGETTTAPAPTTSTAPDTTAPAEEARILRIYLVRGEKLGVAAREVPATEAVGRAAIEALLEGPTESDRSAGLATTIPEGTRLLDLGVADRIATVDLSGEFDDGGGSLSMTMRLAQVVYTLTQFETVDAVLFRLDGVPVVAFGGEGIVLEQPVDRDDFESVTPAILVESPAPGEVVGEPLRISGTANTFEANILVRVTDAGGKELHTGFVTATSGNGTRGTFEAELGLSDEWTPGPITLAVFEESADDGSVQNLVEIPLVLGD